VSRDAKALFIMIGAVAKTQWLPASLERDANGYICASRDITHWSLDREPVALETSIPGIFCVGDGATVPSNALPAAPAKAACLSLRHTRISGRYPVSVRESASSPATHWENS
jgi:thioredoxin reductase